MGSENVIHEYKKPKPYEYILMAKSAYDAEDGRKATKDLSERSWENIETILGNDSLRIQVYVHHENKQIVLAFRGTAPETWQSFWDTLKTDVISVVGNSASPHTVSAIQKIFASEKVVDKISDGYELSFTGHSLGGFLAEQATDLCTYEAFQEHIIAYLKKKKPGTDERNFKNILDNVSATTFDSTGYIGGLNNCKPKSTQPLNVISYKFWANPINSLLEPSNPSMVYALTPDIDKNKITQVITSLRDLHTIETYLTCFDPSTGYPKPEFCKQVMHWPTMDTKEVEKLAPNPKDFFDLNANVNMIGLASLLVSAVNTIYQVVTSPITATVGMVGKAGSLVSTWHKYDEISTKILEAREHMKNGSDPLSDTIRAFMCCGALLKAENSHSGNILTRLSLDAFPRDVREFLILNHNDNILIDSIKLKPEIQELLSECRVKEVDDKYDCILHLSVDKNVYDYRDQLSACIRREGLLIKLKEAHSRAIKFHEMRLNKLNQELIDLRASLNLVAQENIKEIDQLNEKITGLEAKIKLLKAIVSQEKPLNRENVHLTFQRYEASGAGTYQAIVRDDQALSAAFNHFLKTGDERILIGSEFVAKEGGSMIVVTKDTSPELAQALQRNQPKTQIKAETGGQVTYIDRVEMASPLEPLSLSSLSNNNCWHLPEVQNGIFVEREQYSTIQFSPKQKQITILSGIGGSGKSTYASYLANRLVENSPSDHWSVLWFDASSKRQLEEQALDLAIRLNLYKFDDKPKPDDVCGRLTSYLEKQKYACLLVFDNADSYDVIKPYIPSNCAVLITSRNPNWPSKDSISNISFDIMTKGEARKLYQNITGRHDSDSVVNQLVFDQLGLLPLAIVQAAFYIKNELHNRENPVAAYLALYADLKKRHPLWKKDDFADELLEPGKIRNNIGREHYKTIALTWGISFSKLQKRFPIAVYIQNNCAFLDSQVPMLVLERSIKSRFPGEGYDNDFERDIEELERYSLAKRQGNALLVTHQLVREVIRYHLLKERREEMLTSLSHLIRSIAKEGSLVNRVYLLLQFITGSIEFLSADLSETTDVYNPERMDKISLVELFNQLFYLLAQNTSDFKLLSEEDKKKLENAVKKLRNEMKQGNPLDKILNLPGMVAIRPLISQQLTQAGISLDDIGSQACDMIEVALGLKSACPLPALNRLTGLLDGLGFIVLFSENQRTGQEPLITPSVMKLIDSVNVSLKRLYGVTSIDSRPRSAYSMQESAWHDDQHLQDDAKFELFDISKLVAVLAAFNVMSRKPDCSFMRSMALETYAPLKRQLQPSKLSGTKVTQRPLPRMFFQQPKFAADRLSLTLSSNGAAFSRMLKRLVK